MALNSNGSGVASQSPTGPSEAVLARQGHAKEAIASNEVAFPFCRG
jgi:hypothetical protein